MAQKCEVVKGAAADLKKKIDDIIVDGGTQVQVVKTDENSVYLVIYTE